MKKDIFKRRPSISKWMRRKSNGCLDYAGPKRGGINGNPLISIFGGHATTHLRRWVWEQQYGPLHREMYVRMKCNNAYCHEPSHMRRARTHPPYGPKKNEFIVRFSEERICTIQYYRGKVYSRVIARLMGIEKISVCYLWNSTCKSKISIPKGWHPSQDFDRRVEDASIKFGKLYLGTRSIQLARQDVARSRLLTQEKDIITRVLDGEKTLVISKNLKLSNSGVWYIFKKALLSLYMELGDRRWIYLASKGHIYRWYKTNSI